MTRVTPGLVALVCLLPPPVEAGVAQHATLVGPHPHATAQPTADGRRIGAVEAFGGRVFFGYGDGTRNTGPIVISSYEPATGTWADHITFQSEVVGRFRVLPGALWAPAIDPRGGLNLGYALGGTAEWTQHLLRLPRTPAGRTGVLHVFDVAALGNTDERFLSGSFYTRNGEVATSFAGVARFVPESGWTMSLSVPGSSAPRFYELAELDGRLYTVLGGLSRSGSEIRSDRDVGEDSYVYNGERWERGPKLDGFVKPIRFGAVLVYRSEEGEMRSFDGEKVTRLVMGGVKTHAVEGDTLVVVSGDRVYSTSDLRRWKLEGTVPPATFSIGVLDGVCYLGTSDGEIYRLDLDLR